MNHIERICKLIQILAGHEFEGLRNSDIADAMNISRSKVTRDLQSLISAGMVEPMPNEPTRWRLGPKFVQIGLAHMEGMARVESRVSEVKNRYTRLPS